MRMWLDGFTVLCRECPDLVAVYESSGGRLALLLRHTPVPLMQEYGAWRAETRKTAHIIVAKLRKAGLRRWYEAMAPCWLDIEPALRQALVLRTHRWVAERLLAPAAAGHVSAHEDLGVGGRLWGTLAKLIPANERAAWRPWLCLVVSDLEGALRRPIAKWDQAWARWLLLIAYSIPAPVKPPPASRPGLHGTSHSIVNGSPSMSTNTML